ncbi:MAG: hypothetical protein KDD38_09235 [Bdellovibrionales bacterium]|nr:hypothetical protein [Bdellovibrionales bacterium]
MDLAEIKTPRKIKFEAEIENIISLHGDLEAMRTRLGYSRRQICEELMVDPSAWTRWTQKEGSAPPHVYKTLSLLLPKLESQGLDIFKQRESLPEIIEEKTHLKEQSQNFELSHIEALRSQMSKIETDLQNREILSVGWKLLLILNFILIMYVLIR